MRYVPLTVRVTSSESPQFLVNGNHIDFQNENFKLGELILDSSSPHTIAKLFLSSCTVVLVGDSQKAATDTLTEILEYGCSIELASISAADICKNRSFVDVLGLDQSRKYLKSMPLNRILKKTKLTKTAAQQTYSPLSGNRAASSDLPRLRSVTVVSIYHDSNVLTIIDLAGPERLNSFCRLNDGANPDTKQHGYLSSFIFDLVPMNNTKYYLHLDQGGEEESIMSLLNIFGESCANASPSVLSQSVRSSSPFSGTIPNYAKPTKSSTAPKKITSIYLVNKPKANNARKSIYRAPHVNAQIDATYKKSQFKKMVSDLKSQYFQSIATLKSDLALVKETSGPLRASIDSLKTQFIAARKGAEELTLKYIQEIEDLKRKILDAEQKSNTEIAAKDESYEKQVSCLRTKLKEAELAHSRAISDFEKSKLDLKSSIETLLQEKQSLESKCNMLSQNEKALQTKVQELKRQNEADSSSTVENLKKLEDENTRLLAKVHELSANQLLHKDFQQNTESEISALKSSNMEKAQEIIHLTRFKSKVNELETSIVQLKKELKDAKAQIRTTEPRLHDQVQVVNSNEDVAKIFGYPDVDFGNISTSFSPISGYDHLSQIEFPSILKKPISGIASSPNRILRQSNTRFNAPPIGKLASSPARKDLRSWDDIENQQ